MRKRECLLSGSTKGGWRRLHAINMKEIGNQYSGSTQCGGPVFVCVCLGVGCKDEGDQEELP